jgi:hypothetical protein
MAGTTIVSVNYVLREISIYYGIPVFIMGVISAILNIIVFLSLKTFRQSSCAFYLMIISVFNLGQFFSNTLPSIVSLGFGQNWAVSSLFICKIKAFVLTTSTLSSMTCLCLAIIDQYFAICSHPRWQQCCNIKFAHRLTTIFVIIWILHGIPYSVFYDHSISPSMNQTVCQITNDDFIQYHTYGYFLILNNLLPLITVIFGLMAYRNARQLVYRTVPIVRLKLDRQLTKIVLIQVLISFCTFLPYSIQSMSSLTTLQQNDPIVGANKRLATSITFYFSILSYAVGLLW